MRYIAFDVETPNHRNDCISALGVTVVEDGAIREERFSYVNPEAEFDPFNIRLTGITPALAATGPAFPALWETLEPLFDSGLLAAHNARFDLGVLGKCLRMYGILWKPQVDYVCTVQMSRRCFPELPNHKLDTVSRALGIPLDHHHAGSDSRACAEILTACLARGADLRRFRKTFSLLRI